MDYLFIRTTAKSIPVKVAFHPGVPLQSHHWLGQRTVKQLAIEEIIGTLEGGVLLRGNGFGLNCGCVRTIRFLFSRPAATALWLNVFGFVRFNCKFSWPAAFPAWWLIVRCRLILSWDGCFSYLSHVNPFCFFHKVATLDG
jgi:hypothetical protein